MIQKPYGQKILVPFSDGVPFSAHTRCTIQADRYAGSRGDPARMASNFAGVQGLLLYNLSR